MNNFHTVTAPSILSRYHHTSLTSRGLAAGYIVQKKASINYLLYLFERFMDPSVKPQEVGRGSWIILYLFVFTFFLSGCAKQEHAHISPSKHLGFIEKMESFVFNTTDQHQIAAFKLFLEDFKNNAFLRVKFYYPSKTSTEFRHKIQHLLLKHVGKIKKIDFYKDIYMHAYLKIDLIRYKSVLPLCPDWSSPIPSSKENEKLSNLGCAQQTNLGLMLEDPYDLKESSSLTPGLAQEKIDAFNDKNTESREMENVWPDTKSFTK